MMLGALALVVSMADTARLFVRAGNYAFPAIAIWSIWTLGLTAPLIWAWREPMSRRDAARNYLVLGYGTAILALRVVETCLPR
jgi:hypothetical protein